MKKLQKSLLLLVAVVFVLTAVLLVACTDKVTMTFETNGGTKIPAIKAKAGEEITPPSDPTKEGYNFAGWYLDADCNGDRQQIPTVMPEKDVTYYAKWIIGAQVILTLDPGLGGTLSQTSYTVATGTNLSNFLKNIVPTAEAGLEFAGWYNDDKAISDSDTMPGKNLTLKAKYYVNYTVLVYEQGLDGSYPSNAQAVTEQAFYGESFTYESSKEHFHVDTERDNVLSSASLGKNETFTAYLARDIHTVYYFNTESSSEYHFDEVLYGNTVEIAGAIFYVDELRFAAWTQTPDEQSANGEYFFAGDKLLVDNDYFFFTQWDYAYYDMFGGSDYVFIPRFEDGVAVLDRIGIEEKLGTYDTATNVFSFKDENDNEMLGGKIVGNYFYYYRDSVEKVYADFDNSQATLEMKASGVAVYTDEQNVATTGTYDVNEEGFYLFVSDTVNFVYRLESNDETGNNEIKFRKQSNEAGYYIPAKVESEDGVVLYYLNGFGEGWELYSASNPYYDPDTGITLTRIPLIYREIDKGDNFVTYRLYSVILDNDSYAHMFDFRIQPGSSVVNGKQTNGSMIRGDGFAGTYLPNNVDNTVEGQTLHLDGFGGGTYGDKTVTYEPHTEYFFVYDPDNNEIVLLFDNWVSFKIDGEAKSYKIRPRSFDDEENFYYDWINGELFGLYEFEADYEEDGETYKTIIYVYAGYCESLQLQNCALLLVQVGDFQGYTLWSVYDYHYGDPLEASDNVYTLAENGTRFFINESNHAEFAPEEDVEITLFDDENGKLVIDQDGVATYTPVGGQPTTVDYVVEQACGYSLYAVYTFDIHNTKYVFVYYRNDGKLIFGKATALVQDSAQADAPIRIVLYNESDGVYSAAVGFIIEGSYYYYALEGNVQNTGDGTYSFHCTAYDDNAGVSEYYYDFNYSVQDGVFTIQVNKLVLSNEESTLVLDGLGNAVLTQNNQVTQYSYVEFFSHNGTVIIYVLIGRDSNRFIKVNEEEHTFKFVEIEAGRYGDLVSYNRYLNGDADTYNYIVLDGDGVVYYLEVGNSNTSTYIGEYVKTGNVNVGGQNWYEYTITVDYKSGQTLSQNIILYVYSDVYFVKDLAQEADYQVEGGGRLKGNGYGFYEELGQYATLATYTDENGETYYGILKVGTYDDSQYNTRTFTPATTLNERKVVLFTLFAQSNDGYYPVSDIFFDLVTVGDRTVAQLRIYQSGAFRLADAEQDSQAKMYLDGHGNATLYNANGIVTGNGTYEMAQDIDEYSYRYIGDDNQTTFLFRAYMTQDGDSIICEYATYKSQSFGKFVSEDWAYLELDGYLHVLYVDKYGVFYFGRYVVTDGGLIVFYPDDGSDAIYFELLEDNTFRLLTDGEVALIE